MTVLRGNGFHVVTINPGTEIGHRNRERLFSRTVHCASRKYDFLLTARINELNVERRLMAEFKIEPRVHVANPLIHHINFTRGCNGSALAWGNDYLLVKWQREWIRSNL